MTDSTSIILGIGLLVAIIAIIVLILKQKNTDNSEKVSEEVGNQLNKLFPELMRNANEQLVLMASEKLKAEKGEIRTDLSNKKQQIEEMVKRVLQELMINQERLEKAEKERVGSFMALKQEIEGQRHLTEQLSATTEGLKKVLSNNQLRGQFGEQVAEDLLKMNGFVKGTDYEFNKEQKSADTRPDFAIFLPDGTRINVDAKFPYANLQKMIDTDDRNAKKELLKAFERDIRDKIKQVSTRDYINPEDRTVDFVILFIPNEMIFSFVYDKLNTTWADAMSNKVIMAGPFSFTAILRMVRQAYDNFKYQENAQKIIGYIKTFEKEFIKYNEEFEKVGLRIDAAAKQFDAVNNTRTNKLLRTIDKIKLDSPDSDSPVKAIEKPDSPGFDLGI